MSRPLPPILSVLTGLALVLAACSTGTAPTVAPTTAPTAAPTTAPTTPSPTEPTADTCLPSTETGTVAVQIQGFAFAPGRVQAKVGEVITFTNSDGAPHTATLDVGSCTTPTLGKDASGSLVFSAAGEYPFHCRIHPDMTGTFEISG
ncbi:MAG: cupredoxin domain-containing protein [Chloroflexota bacterium]